MDANVVSCPACGKKNRVPAAARGAPRCGSCTSALPWVVEATDDNYAEIVEASKLPVVVDLWAKWCQPCLMVSPALDRMARQFAGLMKLVKVDVDRSPGLSARFAIQGIPTLLIVRNGQVVARRTGAAPEATLHTWLEEGLAARA